MKVLVVGSGGREHALVWKLLSSPQVTQIFVAPGNAGTALMPKVQNIAFNGIDDITALCDWVQKNDIALTIVGPEAPLAAGLVDALEKKGALVFGPSQAAAQLESSKAFAKAFMQRHTIPTARYATFTEAQAAKAYIAKEGAPIVIKADGLCAGKGVVVAMTLAEALAAVDHMLPHPDAGRVVIEEFLLGEEASFIVVSDGQTIVPLATSQDHKRLSDGDTGPNTGGMGAYSPAPVVSAAVHDKVMREIVVPTIEGMKADGITYRGFLYAGLMIAPDGSVKTLEFNCRMGDPETQPIMMRLESDLFNLLHLASMRKLNQVKPLQWSEKVSLGVVLASAGYPDRPQLGKTIKGLPLVTENPSLPKLDVLSEDWADVQVFHAGTVLKDNTVEGGTEVVSSGGRVLCVCALGNTTKQAQTKAYRAIENLYFEGMQFRKDIAYKAMHTSDA